MPTDPLAPDEAEIDRLRQMEASIESLNARIARLAIALGVSLANDNDVAELMSEHHTPPVLHERRATSEPPEAAHARTSPERRVAHQREELRGLLVMRYGIEKRYVEDTGVTVTRQIMDEAEQRLERRGFKPGVDGIDLERLFRRS
jgi:hypothetical protein